MGTADSHVQAQDLALWLENHPPIVLRCFLGVGIQYESGFREQRKDSPALPVPLQQLLAAAGPPLVTSVEHLLWMLLLDAVGLVDLFAASGIALGACHAPAHPEQSSASHTACEPCCSLLASMDHTRQGSVCKRQHMGSQSGHLLENCLRAKR